jgi:hypothetical protein
MGAAKIISPGNIQRFLREHLTLSPVAQVVMDRCIRSSLNVWVGLYEDEVHCVWGVIPPTILSDRAYLWLYTDEEKVSEHQFVFIRRSQIAVKRLLEEYKVLYGTTDATSKKTIRWLKWLGAEFIPSGDRALEFVIRRK